MSDARRPSSSGSFDYDLFVIGAGSGGVRASRMSAAKGARVAVAEERRLGGTCVNVGCIPKKLLVYASHLPEEITDAERGYGWSVGPRRFDWRALIQNKDREIERLNGVYGRLLDDAGVSRIEGRAKLVDRHTIDVAGRRITARFILLAPGSWPVMPKVPGIEHAISSNEAFYLPELPERILIVGGGYIAVEFAGIFHGLGVRTTQIYRGPLFLRGFDDDVRRALAEQLRANGIDLRFDADVRQLERRGRAIAAHLNDGSEIEVDQVMFATGRAPLVEGLGLEAAGVALDSHGAIAVDAYSRTNVENIYAIGDVTNRLNLTPVAIHEAMCFADTVFGGRPTAPNHQNVPSAVFSQPQIGSVGLTEAQARARGEVDVYRTEFRALKHTLTGGHQRTLMKLVVDRASDRVLGVHVVSPDAAEMVQGFAVALQCGATKAQFDATIGIHPTAAEELVTLRTKVG